MSRAPRTNEFEERDYYAPRRAAPEFEEDFRRRVVTRSPPRREERGPPSWLREERHAEAGPVVLSRREVETVDRHRRSPSPVVYTTQLVRRPRSVSPPRTHHSHEHEHETERSRTRYVERERIRSPSVERRRSPSARPIRYVERPRPRSPDPERERIRTRIIDRERARSSSSSSASSAPSPPPQPKVVQAPTIEREVITHYRGIDHGVMKVRQPSPAPAPAPAPRARSRSRVRERETDIDILLSRDKTKVGVDIRDREQDRHPRHSDGELVVYSDRSRRRAHSAAPLRSPVNEEAEFITSKIDSRGRMGEAWHGATKDWAIVDVPPGTERVRMDGVGGGSTDTSWSKYSGVRRTQFIPERDEAPALAPRAPSPKASRPRESTTWDREREIQIDIERNRDRRPSRQAPPKDMWTEISKDLVVREAIEQMGYEYEDTPMFYYIMAYLEYDDVLQLTELSNDIKRYRKDRVREIEWERDVTEDWERRRHRHHHHHGPGPWDEERVVEREVIYDDRRPVRGYLR